MGEGRNECSREKEDHVQRPRDGLSFHSPLGSVLHSTVLIVSVGLSFHKTASSWPQARLVVLVLYSRDSS